MGNLEKMPVAHGEWIEWDDDWFHGIQCSACGKKYCCPNNEKQKSPFCPNCGAKMDKEV